MIELLIIADDFTGALDTGVQFAKKGIQTLVSLKSDAVLKVEKDIQVLVVDSESRHMLPEQAYDTIYKIASEAKRQDVRYIYKKTDSTLRGNIGSEFDGVLDALNEQELMFIPAFPKAGRTTFNGSQCVNGVPLHETVFSKDPLNPVTDSLISNIIAEQSDSRVINVRKEDVDQFPSSESQSKTVCVFDCEKDEELISIGKALKKRGRLHILSGCAGFAEILPEILDISGSSCTENEMLENLGKEMLIVCGSVNEQSLKQVAYAEENGYSGITLSLSQMLAESYYDSDDGLKFADMIKDKIREKHKFIIKTADSRQMADDYMKSALNLNLSDNNVPLKIADNVGKLVTRIIQACKLKSLIVFGGDTSVAIMKALECSGIMPLKEIIPGIAVSKIISDKYNLILITKAGGFGDVDVLFEIEQSLSVHRHEQEITDICI